jgi:hypothetical protein
VSVESVSLPEPDAEHQQVLRPETPRIGTAGLIDGESPQPA